MDYSFSKEYANFIMPPTEELMEEKRVSAMSETEKEVYLLRQDYLRSNGKINREKYEEPVAITLFYADISDEEYKRLRELYIGNIWRTKQC